MALYPFSKAPTMGLYLTGSAVDYTLFNCASLSGSAKSKIRRRLGSQEALNSTNALVACYNESIDEEESGAIREWLQCYVAYFDERFTRLWGCDILEEIACLTKIKSRCDEDKEIVKKAVLFLFNQVGNDTLEQQKTVTALALAMQEVDELVFEGDISTLLAIADTLLSKLDPKRVAFIEGTYPTHGLTLFALHQTLLVIQCISPNCFDPRHTSGLFQSLKARLQEIVKCVGYFPSLFHVKLIEQCLERLGKHSLSATTKASCRIIAILSGCVYLYCGIRKAVCADLDVIMLENAYSRFLDAVVTLDGRKSWYDEFVKLNVAATLSCEGQSSGEELTTCLQQILEAEKNVPGDQDRNLLRFGVVEQLHAVALNGRTSEARRCAAIEMMYLGTRYVVCEGWAEEPAIVKAIVAALEDVIAKNEHKGLATTTLEVMNSCKDSRFQEFSVEWRKEHDDIKHLALTHAAMQNQEPDRLFHVVRIAISVYQSKDITDKTEELKRKYQDANFSMVTDLLNEKRRDVKVFEFHVVYDEEVLQDRPDGNEKDEVKENVKRTQKVRKVIELENLFDDRSLKPQDSPEEITRVLLVGNPGTGKTSIGKKIACDWATEKWGTRFKAVYFLELRQLNKDNYKWNSNTRERPTIACAIANTCFKFKESDRDFEALLNYIEDDLESTSTLVILDGLDESDKAGREMLLQVVHKRCSILFLTRPYDLQDLQSYIQLEVECLGLREDQLGRYVKSELGLDLSGSLFRCFDANPNIREFACIPVTINIICSLWNEQRARQVRYDSKLTLFELYNRMVFLVWKRYCKKTKVLVDRKEVFKALYKIAFETLRNGRIRIDRSIVLEHCSKIITERIIKDSGFVLIENEGSCFQFAHLTFQEFFAGQWLIRHFMERNTSKGNFVENFIYTHKHNDVYRTTFMFSVQGICCKWGRDGFERLLSIATQPTKEKVDEMRRATFTLKVIDAFILCEQEESVHNLGNNIIVSRTMKDIISILQNIKNAENYAFGGREREFLKEVESSLKTVGQFEELFVAIREGMNSDDAECARVMVDIITKIAKESESHAQKFMDFVHEQCKHEVEDVRRKSIRVLDVIAGKLSDRHDSILELTQSACGDESISVRRTLVEYLKDLAREMPQHHDPILMIAQSTLLDESADVRTIAVTYLTELAREMPHHHVLIAGLAKRVQEDESIRVRRALARYLDDLAVEIPDQHDAIIAFAQGARSDQSNEVRVTATAYLKDLAKEMPKHHNEILELVKDAACDAFATVRWTLVQFLKDLAREMPGHRRSILDVAESLCNDNDEDIQHIAKEAFKFIKSNLKEG